MADKKISALTAATTPLAGTEVLPIVQSGSTVKVAVSDLTAGRTPTMNGTNIRSANAIRFYRGDNAIYSEIYNTTGGSGGFVLNNQNSDGFSFQNGGVTQVKINDLGNVVITTAGKGIDFSANGGDVLSQYDEGTWTVQLFDAGSGGNASPTTVTGHYTRIGRQVTATFGDMNAISTAGMTAGNYLYVTLPFTANASAGQSGAIVATSSINFGAGYTYCVPNVNLNSNRAPFGVYGSNIGADALLVSALTSGVSSISRFSVTYFV